MKLVHLIDDREYVKTNCFQHMLLANLLEQCTEYVDVTVAEINSGVKIPSGDVILSTLRLRTIYRRSHQLSILLNGREIYVYDQDPWESFVDTASFKGAYENIVSKINVKFFINTSRWWTDFLNEKGFKSIFARQWPLKHYCNVGPDWSLREIKFGFKGTLHPHRKAAFEDLKKMGLDVTILPAGSYEDFLDDLNRIQFFLNEQSGEKWTIKNLPMPDGLKYTTWAKEIEIAARGTVSIRMYEPGLESYFVDKIPSIMTYRDLSEVPSIIEDALSKPTETKERIKQSVDFIRSQNGWFSLRDLP
jgi:hypothetical protein